MDKQSNKVFVYPNINASYKVVEDLMIFYAGAEGSLAQNSYQDFANENAFFLSTLNIAPTDNQYEHFAGLKGKLTTNVAIMSKVHIVTKNKALFKAMITRRIIVIKRLCSMWKFMQVVYDDMKTLRFSGDLKASFSNDVTFGGEFSKYTTCFSGRSLNLRLRLNSSLDVCYY
jgi:hypothetical protein